MKQYLDLLQYVLQNGTRKENRTGVDTLSTFNYNYTIDLKNGFPLLTTKEISWKNIVVEMLWFLSGQTDISILKRHGCKFWDAWADPITGKVPSAYGNFWRKFPTHRAIKQIIKDISGNILTEVDGQPEAIFNDQIKFVLNELKTNPMSRRMVVSAWDPGNAQTSKLPPCHSLFVLNVQNEPDGDMCFPDNYGGPSCCCKQLHQIYENPNNTEKHLGECATYKRLNLHLTQRSCDITLGVPYNIASYSLLIHIFSHLTGIPVGKFAHTLVDAHIYTKKPDGSMAEYDHIPGALEQLSRDPRPLPTLEIDPSIKSLEDIEALIHPDVPTEQILEIFKLSGYNPHPSIKFKVAV